MEKSEIVVRKITEDITLSDAEKDAEEEAGKRLELLGAISCHSKKPPKTKIRRVIGYGRGKTFHIDKDSQGWKDYQEGKISFIDFKNGIVAVAGAKKVYEKSQWQKDLESGKTKQKVRPAPRPILLY